MKIYSIYKLTNKINGKGYIGFTGQNPNKRFNRHFKNAQQKYNQYLYDAINKYGWENFSKEVIYQSKDAEHTLKEMEPYFIKEQNTYYINGFGYNMTLGGDGLLGHKHSEETKLKLSKLNKGKKLSEATRQKMSKANKGKKLTKETKLKLSELHIGKKHTEETKRKLSKSNTGKKHTEETKKQIGDTGSKYWTITFPDGHIEKIKNLCLFCREHKLTAPAMMAVVAGKQHHHKGYKCQKLLIIK